MSLKQHLTRLALRASGVSAVASTFAVAAQTKAVDPTLTDVLTTLTANVSLILTFGVGVMASYIGVVLVFKGLKKVVAYISRAFAKI